MYWFHLLYFCITVACTNGDVRLMNESDHSSTLGVGRVEICYNNSYWAVCDDRWDVLDAGVVCRQLGMLSSSNVCHTVMNIFYQPFLYSAAVPVKRSRYGSGVVPFLLDNILCRGNESNLLQCVHSGLGIHNCESSETAGVICGGM